MSMDIKELTEKALSYAVASEDDSRKSMTKPRTLEGFTCATNGYMLLGISNYICKKFEGEGKFPDCEQFLKLPDEMLGIVYIGGMSKINSSTQNAVLFCGMLISIDNCNRLRNISLALGITAWRVMKKDNYIMLTANFNEVRLVLMPRREGHVVSTFNLEQKDYNTDINTHWAEFHIDGILAREEAEVLAKKKEWEEKHRDIYSVRVTRSACMYCAARSEEEAIKIAQEYMDELDDCDFEQDDNPDSISFEGDTDSYMETIYTTEDGSMDYDDYMEKYEGEE